MKNLTSEPTAEERELIETLVKYPSLESVFNQNAPTAFAEIKQTMQVTLSDLERVVRRGEKSDAERAATAAAALQTTMNFLNELEKISKNPSS